MQAERIRVQGTVQGVGFRPAVWRLARECGVRGSVCNDAGGVLIHAWGEPDALDRLAGRLQTDTPPLSRVEAVLRERVDATAAPADFRIVASGAGDTDTNVVGDAATCGACLEDLRDPANRRYRYPFTNCTHCGPRLSIVRAVPYDRANTSMAAFTMCPACRAEYDDPADRRFHAQPNACPDCGPRAWLETADGAAVCADDPIDTAAHWIREGRIVAVKGLGGFHLACDATNAGAVAALRRRKRRYGKPLALMARDVAAVRRFARVSEAEAALLASAAAPIVVLAAAGATLPDALAPGQDTLGVMLPYTPLHHLLLDALDGPIVLTSGNASDEPQAIGNDDARARLGAIADGFLMHDRDIVNRLDDSVVMVAAGETRVLRRARGYAPEPVALPGGFEGADGILALGGELKNTFCLVSRGRAIVSQHIGDMEDARAQADADGNVALYRALYDFEPHTVAIDGHPDVIPGRAAEWACAHVEPVQHHHAHIAACLVEHGVERGTRPVLGVVLDGLGYGDDGTLWGGEFLLADYDASTRVGHFLPVAMPGGDRAMREPWRNTWAHLDAALGWDRVAREAPDLDLVRWLGRKPTDTLATMCARGLNSPPASSAGRLFDAVAGAIGVCREAIAHEAEAAMALEALARAGMAAATGGYPVHVSEDEIPVMSWRPLWRALLEDLRAGVPAAVIAARFHAGLGDAVAALASRLVRRHGARAIVLSGGVFQNRVLLERVAGALTGCGERVLLPARLPANDGGLSLGQAAVAAARAWRPADASRRASRSP